jgi:hypothetical protein
MQETADRFPAKKAVEVEGPVMEAKNSGTFRVK